MVWPTPDPASVSTLITSLREIHPELDDTSSGTNALLVCHEISKGSDEKSVLATTMSAYAGDGSFSLTKEQGKLVVSTVGENVCPSAQA
ncbi:hypothetical protein [Kitasatospora sp. NPDC092286]|uniref:hypothetical protein n=1 Tax=Kitasatospora sp. NPDC092286 TaxID=3364087 RepID=UPI0038132E8B